MNVILVHGIWDTGRIFRRLVAHLTAQGHHCFCPDLEPANAAHGLVDLAEKLQAYIDTTLGPEEKFALIGFSMGALITRHYLQMLGGADRVDHYFTISGPNNGTLTAYLCPSKGARDMRFGSRFIQALNADTRMVEHIKVHNYRTPFDLMIIPSRSSKWAQGQEHIIPSPLHAWMLIHPKLIAHIGDVLSEASDHSGASPNSAE